MNFKKNWKRFWTLSRASEGFTLVELIVVIAIMAILAGVAVPAYSGYIKKAEKAGDLQLLGAVNTAFAAAVMDRDQKAATELANGSVSFDVANMKPSDYQDQFATYFAGNTGTFKVIKNLVFQGGVFVDQTDAAGYTKYTYTDSEGNTHDFYISDSDAAALAASIFGTSLGADGMLGKVDYVTTLAAELMSGPLSESTFAELIAGPEYGALLAGALGIDLSAEGGPEKFVTTVGGMVEDKMDLLIASGKFPADADRSEDSDLYNAAYNQIVANNAVLNAAKNSDKVSGDILNVLGQNNSSSLILETVNKDSGAGLSQAAMAYGLYTAYATKNGITVPDDPSEVLGKLDTDGGFKDYINDVDGSGQVQKDLDGYIAAMGMINGNVNGNSAAVSDILVNGFANDGLVDLIGGAMGG